MDENRVVLPDDLGAMGSRYVAMHYCGNQARKHISVKRAHVVSAILGLQQGHVLDVGCGPGYSSTLVARRVTRVTAIDVDTRKLAIARAIARLNDAPVDVAAVDASRPLPFATGQFDGLVSLELIEHLKDWRSAIGEMCRVVKPGGRVAISTPTRHGAAQVLKSACLRTGLMAETTYEWFIPQREMEQALRESGVDRIAVERAIFVAPMVPDLVMPVVRRLEQVVESIPPLNRLCSTAIYCGIRR